MRLFRQLSELVHSLPFWGQIALGLALLAFSALSIYGRINTRFGAKAFSRIPEDEVRTNIPHILWYTVIPALATVFYWRLVLSS